MRLGLSLSREVAWPALRDHVTQHAVQPRDREDDAPLALLKFSIAHPAVTCVIPGAGDPRHMADNLAAGHGRLPTPAERDGLAAMLR
jgi:aryl-alcohol dehydrogenase-like predicted oxidoreductase